MLTVPLHADGQPCDNCGHRSSAISVNVQYLDRNGELSRANKVHPCGCLLGVDKVANGRDSRNVRRVPRQRRSSRVMQ